MMGFVLFYLKEFVVRELLIIIFVLVFVLAIVGILFGIKTKHSNIIRQKRYNINLDQTRTCYVCKKYVDIRGLGDPSGLIPDDECSICPSCYIILKERIKPK